MKLNFEYLKEEPEKAIQTTIILFGVLAIIILAIGIFTGSVMI